MKKLLVFLLSILLIFSVGFIVACSKPDSDNPDQEEIVVDTLALNYTNYTLEKYEELTLIPTLNGSVIDEVVWASLNDNAVVNNGIVEAKKAGNTIITATHGDLVAKCIISVTDKEKVPKLQTNVDNNVLYIYPGDTFLIENLITYNAKPLNVAVNMQANCQTAGCLTLEDNVISAVSVGNAKIVVSATWKDFNISEVISVSVIPNINISIYNNTRATIFNDIRGGATTFALTPSVMENDAVLTTSEYVIDDIIYDNNIISVDEDTLVVTGLHKGSTELKLVFKSLLTGTIADISLPVDVKVYTQDKTETITLADRLYLNTAEYILYSSEIYKDLNLTDSDYSNMVIDRIVDVTTLNSFDLAFADNKINIATSYANGLSAGARKWQIESGDISYIVNVNVQDADLITPNLKGTYNSVDSTLCGYNLEVRTNENNNSIITFIDDDGQTVESGLVQFEKFASHSEQGYFNVVLNGSSVFGQSSVKGIYFYSNNCYQIWFDFHSPTYSAEAYTKFFGEIKDLSSLVAGTYSSQSYGTVILNEDLTCSAGNNTGSYSITPKSAYNGIVAITINGTTVNTYYTLSKGGNTLTVDSNLLTTENYDGTYDKFAGFYNLSGFPWCQVVLPDGTTIFAARSYSWAKETSFGCYVLNSDGTYEQDILRPYSNTNKMTGTYQDNEGVLTITIKVPSQGEKTYKLQTAY